MNKDEMKMIEDMAKVISQAPDKCFGTECKDCKYYHADDDFYCCQSVLEAEVLYNAGYRKVFNRGDGAMVDLLNQETRELQRVIEIRQETVRDIISIIIDDDGADLNKIAQKYGIETEWIETYKKHKNELECDYDK